MKIKFFIIFFVSLGLNSQTINLNQFGLEEELRNQQILGNFKSNISFTIRPIHFANIDSLLI